MSFEDFINETGGQSLMEMSDKEKDIALNSWLTDPSKREYILHAIGGYLIDDHHIASALLLDDASCGRSLKNSFYAAFESGMQDCIDGLI